jgi:hypothetical protein
MKFFGLIKAAVVYSMNRLRSNEKKNTKAVFLSNRKMGQTQREGCKRRKLGSLSDLGLEDKTKSILF